MAVQIVLGIWGLCILLWFSYADIKHKNKLDTDTMWCCGIVALIIGFIAKIGWVFLLLAGLSYGLGFILHRIKAFGGADVVILTCLMPCIGATSFANGIVKWLAFWLILLVIGLSYALIFKFCGNRRIKNIPFVPAILIGFILYWVMVLRSGF